MGHIQALHYCCRCKGVQRLSHCEDPQMIMTCNSLATLIMSIESIDWQHTHRITCYMRWEGWPWWKGQWSMPCHTIRTTQPQAFCISACSSHRQVSQVDEERGNIMSQAMEAMVAEDETHLCLRHSVRQAGPTLSCAWMCSTPWFAPVVRCAKINRLASPISYI